MSGRAAPWWARAWDALALYLPLALMGGLALATWAIVQRAPQPEAAAARALAHGEAGSTLHAFALRRYDAQGRLQAELRGRSLTHYPADGLTEVHDAWMAQTRLEERRRSVAQSRRLTVDDARRHYVFEGEARYERQPLPGQRGARLVLQGERFTWDAERQELAADAPVRLMRDRDVLTASRMRYDERVGLAQFEGRVRATLATPTGPTGRAQ